MYLKVFQFQESSATTDETAMCQPAERQRTPWTGLTFFSTFWLWTASAGELCPTVRHTLSNSDARSDKLACSETQSDTLSIRSESSFAICKPLFAIELNNKLNGKEERWMLIIRIMPNGRAV